MSWVLPVLTAVTWFAAGGCITYVWTRRRIDRADTCKREYIDHLEWQLSERLDERFDELGVPRGDEQC